MKIAFDNVNFRSSSGPNAFGSKLKRALERAGHLTTLWPDVADARLSFISKSDMSRDVPTVLRLDGIWFNTRQQYEQMNEPIKQSYLESESIIVQSEFDKRLVDRWFGTRDDVFVVRNGTDIKTIADIEPLKDASLDRFTETWCCASDWRPHKRLNENVRFFFENAPIDACFVVAGKNLDCVVSDERVLYVGDVDWHSLVSLYKRATTFVHLEYLSHCPNVIVDARACGCKIVCVDVGGAVEVAGENVIVVKDAEWNFEACDLYAPPVLDFSRVSRQNDVKHDIDIDVVSKTYTDVLMTSIKRHSHR